MRTIEFSTTVRSTASRHPSALKRSLAIAVADSGNEKTGVTAITYAAINRSCSPTCPLKATADGKRGPCYAQSGHVGMVNNRLETMASMVDASEVDIANDEARAIDGLTGENAMRLHGSGDCSTPEAADIVASAAERYAARHGSPVWTYTHSWQSIPRATWRRVSVLASVETLEGASRALAAGYAPAIVVRAHPADGRAYSVPAEGGAIRVVPCPAQTRKDQGVNCASCKLCWRADKLQASRSAIAFEAHGASASKARKLVWDGGPVSQA